jgi:hypothetical protein
MSIINDVDPFFRVSDRCPHCAVARTIQVSEYEEPETGGCYWRCYCQTCEHVWLADLDAYKLVDGAGSWHER